MSLKETFVNAAKIAGELIKNEGAKLSEAKEKYNKQGIDNWDEDRLRRELRRPLNFYERGIVSQKLRELQEEAEREYYTKYSQSDDYDYY